jgi:hypothetical protein
MRAILFNSKYIIGTPCRANRECNCSKIEPICTHRAWFYPQRLDIRRRSYDVPRVCRRSEDNCARYICGDRVWRVQLHTCLEVRDVRVPERRERPERVVEVIRPLNFEHLPIRRRGGILGVHRPACVVQAVGGLGAAGNLVHAKGVTFPHSILRPRAPVASPLPTTCIAQIEQPVKP